MARRLDTGCTTGGILKLRELIEEHPKEIAYDFRAKFNLSFLEIGKTITWLEAVLLVASLGTETDSHLQAAINEWRHPVSREWIVMTHVYDLLAQVNSKRPKPYPTPWPNPNVARLRPKQAISRDDVLRNLKLMNPKDD